MLIIAIFWLVGTACVHCVFLAAVRKEHRDVTDITFCLAILLMSRQPGISNANPYDAEKR